MTNLKTLAMALPMAGILLTAPLSTSHARPTNDLLTGINVTGVAIDVESLENSSVTGTVNITGFAFDAVNRALFIEGIINGIATSDGVTTQIVGQVFTTSGTLTSDGRRCQILTLDLGPLFLDLLGLQIDLSDIQLDVAAVRGPGRLLGNLLCQLVRFLDGNASVTDINRQIIRINNVLNTLLTNIPVSGTVPGGTFDGLLTITGLGVDNAGNVVFNGILNGTARDNGTTTEVISQLISATGTLTGTGGRCQLLHLDLGPLHLDLLGLEVDLSQINLDLSATQGSGNLLGNLLCNLTQVLDRGGKNQQRKLSQLVQRINGLLN